LVETVINRTGLSASDSSFV